MSQTKVREDGETNEKKNARNRVASRPRRPTTRDHSPHPCPSAATGGGMKRGKKTEGFEMEKVVVTD
jgi:hypothetical protein